MKRTISILMSLLLIVGLVGCSDNRTYVVTVDDAMPTESEQVERARKDEDSANFHKAGERMTLIVGGVEYAFRWIPKGAFVMGSPETEPERWGDEVEHNASISRGFWMLEVPITQEMWKSVMKKNPSYHRGFFKNTKRFPVERVSWNDCQEFIEKLNGLGGRPKGFIFSLPTETEWEYACRAGTTTPYSFGSLLDGDKANCDGNRPYGVYRRGTYLGKTSETGKYPPNGWGLYDMHGNVCEWVQDRYGDYPTDDVADPTGPEKGMHRVSRGGAWRFYAANCRSAFRARYEPDRRDNRLGARLVLRPLD